MLKNRQLTISLAITLLLMGAVKIEHWARHTSPEGATEFQAYVAQVVNTQVPMHFRDWVGTDTEIQKSAIAILHPNAMVSRHYQHVGSGESGTFLITDCSDARDMLGHFPPICYPAVGWTLQSSEVRDLRVGQRTFHTTRYFFISGDPVRPTELVVDNFMLLPNDDTCPNMDGVSRCARTNRRKFYGIGQVQVVYDTQDSAEDRDRIFQAIVGANTPVIDAILGGTVGKI